MWVAEHQVQTRCGCGAFSGTFPPGLRALPVNTGVLSACLLAVPSLPDNRTQLW